uniref:Uncharacterized protein n=1 Tax=Panagrolaimus davidi TaxID=227884 RepID=A0A914QTJ2_9BILA
MALDPRFKGNTNYLTESEWEAADRNIILHLVKDNVQDFFAEDLNDGLRSANNSYDSTSSNGSLINPDELDHRRSVNAAPARNAPDIREEIKKELQFVKDRVDPDSAQKLLQIRVMQKRNVDTVEKANEASDESDSDDIIIRNCENSEIFKHEETPKQDELETLHKKNSGYEMVSNNVALSDLVVGDEHEEELPKEVKAEEKHDKFDDLDERKILERARNENDEYGQKTQMESYYAIAHKIKEEISKQHSTLGGGEPTLQLKSYQIKGLEWMISLYNNNLNGILADEM